MDRVVGELVVTPSGNLNDALGKGMVEASAPLIARSKAEAEYMASPQNAERPMPVHSFTTPTAVTLAMVRSPMHEFSWQTNSGVVCNSQSR